MFLRRTFGHSSEMIDEPNFQPMEELDLRTVVAIEQRVKPFGWILNTFRFCLHNAAYECWKLNPQASFIGYFVLYFVGRSARLLNLCVDLPYQGKGFGRDLLCFALARCRERKANEVLLEVRVSNTVAQHLYSTMGFRKVDRLLDYYQSPHGREHADVFALKLM